MAGSFTHALHRAHRSLYFPFMAPRTNFCNKCGAQNDLTAQLCANCGEVQRVVAQATPVGVPPVAVRQNPVTASVRYAGFWIRFVAALIDGLLIQMAVWPIFLLPGLASSLSVLPLSPWPGFHQAHRSARFALAVIVGWIYKAWMESSIEQATLGKKAMGLKVVGLQGDRISFARASGRYFAKLISAIFLIGYIMAGFSKRKQALHDMIADTLVLRIQS